jgi:non-ribosomal peptide synthetase component E (peptide arylation enzyme)
MILGDDDAGTDGYAATLDELFRRAGVRSPGSIALIDPPDRESFTDNAPRQLSYADSDQAISAFAARLRGLGLSTDAVIALQLPNTVEGVIALLGVLRAGMIAAPLPILWRQHEVINALRGIGAKAIVTCARAGKLAPARSAVLAAAELFPIRHICAFGEDLPDGVVRLDEVFEEAPANALPGLARPGAAAAHVAVLTFDVTAHGVVPVPRNHAQLLAGGRVLFLEAGLAQDASLISTIPPTSFAGLSVSVVPWLMSGGTLALHHGNDLKGLGPRCATLGSPAVVLPGPVASLACDAGLFDTSVKSVLALWRAPERLETCVPWHGSVALIDVAAFGEIGFLAARRAADGMPRSIPCGPVTAPRDAAGAINVADTTRYKNGTLAMRGPMVPMHAFPPGAEHRNEFAPDPAGYVDTGFSCRWDGNALTVTAPPANLAVIGGYRFARSELETEVARVDPHATIVAVPDGIIGERLAGAAGDSRAVIAALQARGVNPLLAGAFRPRGEAEAA